MSIVFGQQKAALTRDKRATWRNKTCQGKLVKETCCQGMLARHNLMSRKFRAPMVCANSNIARIIIIIWRELLL
jgi:hypothetical protein